MKIKDILNIKIEHLGLDTRTFHGLYKYNNIHTVRELLYFCADDEYRILRVSQCGIGSKREIQEILSQLFEKVNQNIYLGMPKEELDKISMSGEEVEDFEFQKKNVKYKYLEKKRREFLKTPLDNLGIDYLKFFHSNDSHPKTIGYLLQCISDNKINEDYINELMILINKLGLSGIYLGMPKEDIDISFRSFSSLNRMIHQAESEKDLNTSSTKSELENEVEVSKTEAELKQEACSELETLVKEKERLAALDSELDAKIESLLSRIDYGKQKRLK